MLIFYFRMVIEAYLYLVSRSACVNNIEISPIPSPALSVTQKAQMSAKPSSSVSRKRNSTPTILDQPASKMLRELTYRIEFVIIFFHWRKRVHFNCFEAFIYKLKIVSINSKNLFLLNMLKK